MIRGKFAPGKRVLLLRSPLQTAHTAHLVRTVQVLEEKVSETHPMSFLDTSETFWSLVGVLSLRGKRVAWSQVDMILIDPDETPDESAEAMRRLHDTTVPAKKKEPVVRPFQWEAL